MSLTITAAEVRIGDLLLGCNEDYFPEHENGLSEWCQLDHPVEICEIQIIPEDSAWLLVGPGRYNEEDEWIGETWVVRPNSMVVVTRKPMPLN